MQIHNAIITGSFSYNGEDLSNVTSSNAYSASLSSRTTNLESTASVLIGASASFSSILTSVSSSQQQISSSLLTLTASYNALSSSYTSLSASYNVASSSFSTRITNDSSSFSSRTTQIEKVYATTGSNTFTGIQNFSNTCTPNSFTAGASIYTAGGLQVTQDSYFSSSVYIKGNVTVYGTQSVSYVSSSQLNIGTNVITVNTFTPAVRFGGLSVFDSGSTGLTGSIFWDSQNNNWIYVNASGSGGGATYGGGMFISGPRNTIGMGCEQGTTACMLMVGQGGDHMTSSMIYHDSNATCFPNTILGAGQICSPYHTATSTCSTAGLRVYGASGTHQWDMYLNGANIRFSDNTTGGAFVVDNNVCVGGGLVAQAASTFCNTVALMGSSAQLYIGNSSAASDYSILGWCSTCQYLNIHQQSTGNAPQLVIACNGNVGIGTCYPNSILTVSAIDSNQASNLSTAYTNAKFRVNTYLTSGQGVSIGNIIGYQQYIQAQYSDSVTTNPLILNPFGGPVGIGMGTTCPSYILDVSGSAARVKNTGGSADFILDRASSSAGATYQYVTNGSLKWYTGLRGLVNDNFYLFNNSIGSNALVFDGSSVATFSCTVIACANLLVGTTTAYHSLTVLKNQNGDTATGIYNQTDGTASSTTLRLDNGSYNGQLNLYANSYTTSGTAVANTLRLYTDGPGGISVSATNQHIRFYTSPNECLRMAILYGGAVGIGNSNPKHNLDICSVTTNSGGFSFCNLLAPQGAWCTFACVASDANVVTQVTFTNTLDYNRSGVFVARWAYNTACAALHIVSCLWSNSQNVNFDFRNNSGALQICTSGGGGDYRVQAFTQGAKAT